MTLTQTTSARPARPPLWRPSLGQATVIGGFVVMLVIFTIVQPSTFLAWSTLQNILDQAAVPVLLACGVTFVVVSGQFDLSFTATLGLSAGLGIILMTIGVPVGLALLIVLAVALLIGILVGVLVTLGRASSFVVTLAVGSALTGLELALTNNQVIYKGVPSEFTAMANWAWLGTRLPVWIALLAFVAALVLLHATSFGRRSRAVGVNADAAYLAGVRVKKVRIIAFAIVGVLAGLGALILTSRSGSYYPNTPGGFLLSTYAAVFLGASISRHANFSVPGSAFGVIWLLVLQTGLTMSGQPAWTSNLIQGVVLALAVLIAARGRRSGS